MNQSPSNERSFAGIPQLSLRSLLLGMLGSCIITASSMYVALRISALPWPTIFVAVLSMALLKAFGRTTLNEINITQTAMSAGAMVAGGLAFTLPGLWIIGLWRGPGMLIAHFWPVLGIALAGMLIGTVSTWYLRLKFIVRESLPYPIGVAAAETITVGDAGGKKFWNLFGSMGFSAAFTILRDIKTWIPAAISPKWFYAQNIFIGIWLSPMAVGIGYMIGTLYTGIWFLGAILSYVLIIPLGLSYKFFLTVDAVVKFKNTIGIGLMVGTGVGILLKYLWTFFKNKRVSPIQAETSASAAPVHSSKTVRILTSIALVASFVLSVACGLSPVVSVLLMLGVLVTSAMAATITGETSINPMEIFGIIVLLAIRLIVPVNTTGAFFIATGIAVACGYAGDLLNEYKAGHILGTNPVAQLVAQIAGGLVGTVIAVLAMFAIIQQFGGVGAEKGLPAGQAAVVSQMVHGINYPWVFAIAAAIGILLYLLKVPAMTLGIGIYLPFEISSIIFCGGLLRLIINRFHPTVTDSGNITASGLLGGEGIIGVSIAIYKMLIGH